MDIRFLFFYSLLLIFQCLLKCSERGYERCLEVYIGQTTSLDNMNREDKKKVVKFKLQNKTKQDKKMRHIIKHFSLGPITILSHGFAYRYRRLLWFYEMDCTSTLLIHAKHY